MQVESASAALLQAALWFRDYAEGHLEKGANEKALRNIERAKFCADRAFHALTDAERTVKAEGLAPAIKAEACDVSLPPFQKRVHPWLLACFNEKIAADKLERSDRHVEEVLELSQAVCKLIGEDFAPRAHALVDYVAARPVGEIHQEVGGVMVTLAALCLAHGIDMHELGERELERVWKNVDKIRAKQAAKPTGSALPIATAEVR